MSTEPEHVHYWRPTGEAETEHRVFSSSDGAVLRDSKGRTVGCAVTVRPVEIASRPRREHITALSVSVHPVVPEWEALASGTRGFGVTIQAERDYHTFGASFPKEYYFTDSNAVVAHVEKAVGQAQARQRRQHRSAR